MDDTIGMNISSKQTESKPRRKQASSQAACSDTRTKTREHCQSQGNRTTQVSLNIGHHFSEVVRWSISVHRILFQHLRSKSSSKSFSTFATQWDQVNISTFKKKVPPKDTKMMQRYKHAGNKAQVKQASNELMQEKRKKGQVGKKSPPK